MTQTEQPTKDGDSTATTETLDSLFRNVEKGDTIIHKETGNKAEVIERDQILTKRGREEGLKCQPEDEDRELFLARTLADEWRVEA